MKIILKKLIVCASVRYWIVAYSFVCQDFRTRLVVNAINSIWLRFDQSHQLQLPRTFTISATLKFLCGFSLSPYHWLFNQLLGIELKYIANS